MNSILFFVVIITIPKDVIFFAHIPKSVPNLIDLTEDEKLHIFMFKEKCTRIHCNIYEIRQEKIFI